MAEFVRGDTQHRDRDRAIADRVIAFLQAEGAAGYHHAGGRSLLDHLVGTYEIADRWEQPAWLAHAALIHSVYGTDSYRHRLLSFSRRDEVSALVGERAERLAYLFAVTPRRLLFAGSQRWAPGLAVASQAHSEDPRASPPATHDELDALVALHLANLAEQARAPDGSPGTWLVTLRDRAEAIFASDAITLPLFIAGLAGLSAADEAACRSAYRQGVAETDAARRADRLAIAAAICPVVGEPCVWLAYEAWSRGDLAAAREWADTARRRLLGLGAAWDKRLRFDEWLTVVDRVGRGPATPGAGTVTDPRCLRDALTATAGAPGSCAGPTLTTPPDPATASARFQSYMAALADTPSPRQRLRYPGLDSRPWWEPAACALAVELESRAPEIRQEVLALGSSRFAPESERIARTGEWDVVFFYERGRRHDDVCTACPVTAGVVEGEGAMRTAAGLIYLSRMRPGTHIQPHRGPTNLRVRCHLGIAVPDGDCAIRVDDQARQWSEGRCLVFDDSFEHEAWNLTTEDRIVLIVDLWHPGLSRVEVHLLSGLQRYASAYARGLDRYWAANAAARGDEPAA